MRVFSPWTQNFSLTFHGFFFTVIFHLPETSYVLYFMYSGRGIFTICVTSLLWWMWKNYLVKIHIGKDFANPPMHFLSYFNHFPCSLMFDQYI